MDSGKWDDLRFVLAVAEAGSVNAAAVRLGVNHATILRRVASFEDLHQTRIFVRHAKGYTVAPDAIAIVDAIRAVEKSVEAMGRVISGQGERLDGNIRITSTDSLCQTVLPGIIRDFHRTHPHMSVELMSSNTHVNMSKLDAELTIRPAGQLPSDLVGTRVNTLHFRVYGSVGYLNKNPSPHPADHAWLGITNLLKRSPVGRWQSDVTDDHLAFSADSFVTLADMAETGLGLAMLPTILGRSKETLIEAPQGFGALDTGLWVACHSDLHGSPKIATCREFFVNALRNTDAFLV